MPTISPQEVTRLLADWGRGDRSALDKLFPLVHAELRRIARRQMSHERAGHTLQATALVNEAYLKLAGQEGFEWHEPCALLRRLRASDASHSDRPRTRTPVTSAAVVRSRFH